MTRQFTVSSGNVDEYILVSTATETREQALSLARKVVEEEKLAAGAQIWGPVDSVFWHDGGYGEAQEWRLLFRSIGERFEELSRFLTANHPWANPEIAAVPVTAASEGYLGWVRQYSK